MDHWHPFGVLLENFGYRIIYDSQSRLDAKLDSVLRNGLWCWKLARSEALVALQIKLPEIPLGITGKPIWTIAKKVTYISAETWNFLRKKKDNVDWWLLVWFPHAIPKQAFIVCLPMHNWLSTGDRLLSWGYTGDTKCVFCRNSIESRDHIFFSYSFTYRIWRTCMQRCNPLAPPSDWLEIVNDGCSKWKSKTLEGVLCWLILSSTAYGTWRARNEIRHNRHLRTEEQILKAIFWEVQYRIS